MFVIFQVLRTICFIAGTMTAVSKVHFGVDFIGQAAGGADVEVVGIIATGRQSLRLESHLPASGFDTGVDVSSEEDKEIQK